MLRGFPHSLEAVSFPPHEAARWEMPGFVMPRCGPHRGNGRTVRMAQGVACSPSVLLLLFEGKQLDADVLKREDGPT